MVKIVVIGGSNRRQAQSHRIAELICGMLGDLGAETDLLSFRDVEVPMWSEEKWDAERPADSPWSTLWPDVSARLAAADGFVMVTPEWHGMASPMLKNLLCCADKGEMAFKPAHLVAVSAGAGGAYPIAELRMTGGKNTYLHWTPDHTIIRKAAEFQPGAPEHASEWLADRMRHSFRLLIALSEAAIPIRRDLLDLKTLRNGM